MKVEQVKCASCGASLQIDPEEKAHVCPFCQTTMLVEFENDAINFEVVKDLDVKISEGQKKTEIEFQRLRNQTELSNLKNRLAVLNSDIRAIKRKAMKSFRDRRELKKLRREKSSIEAQIDALGDLLNSDKESDKTKIIKQSKRRVHGFGCFSAIIVFAISAIFLTPILGEESTPLSGLFSFLAIGISGITYFYVANFGKINQQVKDFFTNLNKRMRIIIIVASLLIIVILCVLYSIQMSSSSKQDHQKSDIIITPTPISSVESESKEIESNSIEEGTETKEDTNAQNDSAPEEKSGMLGEPFEIKGDKLGVFDFDKWEGPALIHIFYQGTGNFIADTLDDNNSSVSYGLVNEIDPYEGWKIIDENPNQMMSTRLEVSQASGEFTFTFYPLTEKFTEQVNIPGIYSNHIPTVVYLFGGEPDLIELNYSGEGNFIVDALDENGKSTAYGLVNEIGEFSGEFIVPIGTKYIYVEMASGEYSFSITTK